MSSTYAAVTQLGVTTSYLPYTTAGPSMSPKCSAALYISPADPNSIAAFDPWYGQNVDPAMASCLGTEQTTWWDQADLAQSTLWDLGPINCPNGYTTGSAIHFDSTSTIIACCPTGYTYKAIANAPQNSECVSLLTSGQVITAMSSTSGSWVPVTTTMSGSGFSIHGAQINGWNINFGGTTSTSSSSSSTSATSTSSTSGTSSSTTSPTSSNAAAAASSGLSSGAKIGLGVGISLGIVGIACLGFVLFLLRRRSKENREMMGGGPPGYYPSPPKPPVPAMEMYTPIDSYAEASGHAAAPKPVRPPKPMVPVELAS